MLLTSLILWGGVLEKPTTQSWWRGEAEPKTLGPMLCFLKAPASCLAVWQETLEIFVHQFDVWHILSPSCHDSVNTSKADICFMCVTKKKTTWMFWCILSAFGLIRTPTKIWSLCMSFPDSLWRCRVSGVVFYSVCACQISLRFPPKIHQPQADIISQSKGSMTMVDLFGGSIVA